MKNVKNFIDELVKHKTLAYFVILCGLVMFFDSFYRLNFFRYFFDILANDIAVDLVYLFFELFAGVFLVIFGMKVLKNNFFKAVSKEKVFLAFLFLWSATFIFNGISGIIEIIDSVEMISLHLDLILRLLQGMANFMAGSVLTFFSWNSLTKKEASNTN